MTHNDGNPFVNALNRLPLRFDDALVSAAAYAAHAFGLGGSGEAAPAPSNDFERCARTALDLAVCRSQRDDEGVRAVQARLANYGECDPRWAECVAEFVSPMVESGRRGTGDRPRSPHRPGQARFRPKARRDRHDRGEDGGAEGQEARSGRKSLDSLDQASAAALHLRSLFRITQAARHRASRSTIPALVFRSRWALIAERPPGHRRRSPASGSHRTWHADLPHHALRQLVHSTTRLCSAL